MLQQIGLYPGQRRALQARGRELLVAAEERAGASHLLRAMAILRAARERCSVVLAAPDDRTLREQHMEGKGGIWQLLEDLPPGAVTWLPGGTARLENGSTIHLTTWEAAARRSADVLLLDDGDSLGLSGFMRLREKVLQGPPRDALPRLVLVSRRPDEGWVREHWRAIDGQGSRAQMGAFELPERLRGQPRVIERVLFGDWIDRVMPSFPWHPHTELLVETIQRVVDGEILRLLIQAPPRYFKSLIVSRLLPAYFLSTRPHEWTAVVSAIKELALVMSSDAREFYRGSGGIFRDDSQDKSLWRTPKGGGMWARGVGGWALGVGFNLGIIDDPFTKWEEALKPSVQEAVESYFWNTFYTRREIAGTRPAGIIVMHQRLAEGDLAGRILKREKEAQHPTEGWHLLDLPAIKRKKREPFPPSVAVIPDGRQIGEALCPALQDQSVAALERLEAINKLLFAAVYQQEPFPDAGGGLFERWWWSLACDPEALARLRAGGPMPARYSTSPPDYDSPGYAELTPLLNAAMERSLIPVLVREGRAWDIAASLEGQGDASASVRGGITRMREVIFTDAFERHVEAAGVEDLIVETALRDGVGVEVILPQEPAAAGKILITKLQLRLENLGFRVVVVPTTGSKYVRAMPHAGAAKFNEETGRPGRCHVLPGEWNENFFERHHKFDGVTKPLDLVDAGAYLFSELEMSSFLTAGIQ
jgi:phage terminase large subunit-like protein